MEPVLPSPVSSPLPLTSVLLSAFDSLPDPRVARTRLHSLSDLLLLSLASVCCGAEGFEDMEDWAKAQGEHRLRTDFGVRLPNGIPHHDTFRRVLCRLQPDVLEGCLHGVRQRLPQPARVSHVAIDGKEVRGAHDAATDKAIPVLLSAFASDLNLVLAHEQVPDKSNEIPAARTLLASLSLQGATVTADALHCQKETARLIVERKADYVLAVKSNQAQLLQAITSLFDTNRKEGRLPMQQATQHGKEHGRVETRYGFLVAVADWLPPDDPLLQWTGLTSVLCVQSHTQSVQRGREKRTTQTRYFISSSAAPVQEQMAWVRSHWSIESMHWIMDVTFGEDACRIRKGHEARNMATLRRVAALLLRLSSQGTTRTSIKGRKKTAAWNRAYLLRTLTI